MGVPGGAPLATPIHRGPMEVPRRWSDGGGSPAAGLKHCIYGFHCPHEFAICLCVYAYYECIYTSGWWALRCECATDQRRRLLRIFNRRVGAACIHTKMIDTVRIPHCVRTIRQYTQTEGILELAYTVDIRLVAGNHRGDRNGQNSLQGDKNVERRLARAIHRTPCDVPATESDAHLTCSTPHLTPAPHPTRDDVLVRRRCPCAYACALLCVHA